MLLLLSSYARESKTKATRAAEVGFGDAVGPALR
jgi:hypothetical protein